MKFDLFGRLSGPRPEDEHKLIVFRIAEIRCGLGIMGVREIVNPGRIVPIPTAPPFVLGAADHRSSLVPVVDLRRRLGLPPAPSPRAKWVVALSGGREVALVVDVVTGVVSIGAAEKRERHPLTDGTDVAWVKAVYGGAAGLLFELDVEAILGVDVPVAPEAVS
ncbi:MAG: chemotaxis protein CheW [Proteobacteria bacterium]|jgi:purine-binding chemotaxis protein CheW|nr:chemotaxis protein CheW [Pseudomonadota bacterium]